MLYGVTEGPGSPGLTHLGKKRTHFFENGLGDWTTPRRCSRSSSSSRSRRDAGVQLRHHVDNCWLLAASGCATDACEGTELLVEKTTGPTSRHAGTTWCGTKQTVHNVHRV